MLSRKFLIFTLFVIFFTYSLALGQIPLDPRLLTKFLDPLPLPGVMQPATPGGTYYEVGMWQINQQLHSQLPLTTLWGYGPDSASATYPGATFEAVKGMPIQVRWTNHLPYTHLLQFALDTTLHWADPDFGVPTVAHLHGGEVEPQSDGGPEAWFTQGFMEKGMDWKQEIFNYVNAQPPATLWYHDHALGITRLNVYAGLAGFYLLRDPGNEPAGLPSGPYEIPIVIQDRMFNTDGSLAFPNIGVNPAIHPQWVPEFFGNTILVNGKVWPYLNVEPRKYRFRFLNGSNARFYTLRLIDPITKIRGPAFWQIGTDGGYLAASVMLNDPANPWAPRLTIAPGERADVIIDFSTVPVGTNLLLDNSAKAPFPAGAPADPQTVGQIMQFRVVPLTSPDNSIIPATLNTIPTLTPTVTRTLTLNEVMGPGGPIALYLDGKMWDGDVTELPTLGTTELWQIVNLTADAHPIHLHLVQFQLLNRQRFQVNKYLTAYNAANPVIPVPEGSAYTTVPVEPYLMGKPWFPDPNERGWKDTFRMNPGDVTRALIRFAPVDGSPSYTFDATAEPGYVWHCHIIEHEDNEMMRRYKVVAPILAAADYQPATSESLRSYPNPFNLTAQISYSLPAASHVSLNVYNITGQKVKTLVDRVEDSGIKTITWDGTNQSGQKVATGVYFAKLSTVKGNSVLKLTLLK